MRIWLTSGALSKRFQASLRSPADKVMMFVCAAKSMLMTVAMLPGGARAEATDECLLLATILAQDLDTLRVRPRKGSSASVVSARLPPLGGRRSPVSDDVLASP